MQKMQILMERLPKEFLQLQKEFKDKDMKKLRS